MAKVSNSKIILLLLTAFLLRLWNLDQIPEFRLDEGREDSIGLKFYLGFCQPLTNGRAYIGPIFNYYLGILFYFTGVHYIIPRLFIAVVGTLTVLIVFAFAKAVFNETVGYASAMIVTVSPVHVMNASHMGWSASLTPFFVALSTYFLYLGIKRRIFAYASMIMLGLAVQSHPVAFIAIPGICFFALYKWRAWAKNYACMIASFCLGYANMLYVNLASNFAPFRKILQYKGGYLERTVFILPTNFETYQNNFQLLLLNFTKMLSATKCYSYETMLAKPYFYIYPVILLLGVALCIYNHKDGNKLLLSSILSFFIFTPLFLGKINRFPSPYGTHYIQFIIPLTCVIIGYAIYQFCRFIQKQHGLKMPLKYLIVGLIIGIVLICPIWASNDIYHEYTYTNTTNKPIIEVLNFVTQVKDRTTTIIDCTVPYSATLAKYIKLSTSYTMAVREIRGLNHARFSEYDGNKLFFITCPKFVVQESLLDEFLRVYPNSVLTKITFSNDGDPFYLIYEVKD